MTTTPDSLTLHDYQESASATADPRAYDLEYLIPAIVGEVGELFGQTGKAYWHGWSAEQLQTELISEYGDICWMAAILLKREGISVQPTEMMERAVRGKSLGHSSYADGWLALLSSSRSLYMAANTERLHNEVGANAHWFWTELAYHCQEVTGVSFGQVQRRNLAKLADRAARGVLKGQGDHR